MGFRGARAYVYIFFLITALVFTLISMTGTAWATVDSRESEDSEDIHKTSSFTLRSFRWYQNETKTYNDVYNDDSGNYSFSQRLSTGDLDTQGLLALVNLVFLAISIAILIFALFVVERLPNTWCNKLVIPLMVIGLCSSINVSISWGLAYIAVRHYTIDQIMTEDYDLKDGYCYTLLTLAMIIILCIMLSEFYFQRAGVRASFNSVLSGLSSTSFTRLGENHSAFSNDNSQRILA
jgi:hypothetical protein